MVWDDIPKLNKKMILIFICSLYDLKHNIQWSKPDRLEKQKTRLQKTPYYVYLSFISVCLTSFQVQMQILC
jgi:hypothetical protein